MANHKLVVPYWRCEDIYHLIEIDYFRLGKVSKTSKVTLAPIKSSYVSKWDRKPRDTFPADLPFSRSDQCRTCQPSKHIAAI